MDRFPRLLHWRRSLVLACGLFLASIAPAEETPDPAAALSAADANKQLVTAQTGTWIVNPGEPGPDLPPVGRSLFDFLVSERVDGRPVYRVPFPFSALRQKLLAQLDAGVSGSPLKQVLIPLGRSLQRTAAAPEFFRYPRVVLAVDGETAAQPGTSGMYLKDRLYLGYLEQPGVLEVISYNEAAGRFEFQIVKDYRAGGDPQVVYANRAVCTACHQNATPIFSRPLWSETNADRQVAALLRAEGRDFYGIPVSLGIDIPNAIDDATDRANMIPALQFFWQHGCGANEEDGARTCRARALAFALQYRLTGSLAFARRDNPGWRAFSESFESAVRRRWPEGLLLSDPDIPNRQPVPAVLPSERTVAATPDRARTQDGDRLHRQVHIESHLDPLRPRPPLEHWSAEGSAVRFVSALGDFFAAHDLQRLDRHLVARATDSAGGSGRRYHAACRISPRRRGDAEIRLSLQCAEDTAGFSMTGRVYLSNGRLLRGVIDRLTTFDGSLLLDLVVSGGRLERFAEGARLTLQLSRTGLNARTADGNVVRDVRISWRNQASRADGAAASVSEDGQAVLELTEDFPALRQAIDGISGDALSARPLRRAVVLQALYARLGMPGLRACCSDADGLPQAALDADALASASVLPGVPAAAFPEQGFYQYCAHCHRSGERFPPNFLQGDRRQVRDKLAHCAERLYLRLHMWELPVSQRVKTPMPPVHALQQVGMNEENWRQNDALKDLQGYVQQLLERQIGRPPQLKELAGRGYENLRTCLQQSE